METRSVQLDLTYLNLVISNYQTFLILAISKYFSFTLSKSLQLYLIRTG